MITINLIITAADVTELRTDVALLHRELSPQDDAEANDLHATVTHLRAQIADGKVVKPKRGALRVVDATSHPASLAALPAPDAPAEGGDADTPAVGLPGGQPDPAHAEAAAEDHVAGDAEADGPEADSVGAEPATSIPTFDELAELAQGLTGGGNFTAVEDLFNAFEIRKLRELPQERYVEFREATLKATHEAEAEAERLTKAA